MKKYMDLEAMANANCSNVLDIIQKNGPLSRGEITKLSGLSWGGMTKIVNKLLENGYIVEGTLDKNPAGGRTPHALRVNTERNFVIGLDINKTGLKAIVSDLTGKTRKSFFKETNAESREGFLAEITGFISGIFRCFAPGAILSIGVAMQGIVDSEKGISVRFPDIGDWQKVPLKALLEERFGVSVFLEHDPDCLLYPHLKYGLRENTVLLRIDRSIGMAAAIDGRIIKGTGIFEIAHNTVIPNGAPCRCGCRGCIEAYIRPCIAADGSLDAEKTGELMLPLAITVKNLAGVFCAGRVILTGTLMEHDAAFREPLREAMAQLRCEVRTEFAPTSDLAVQGAALIAVDKAINSLFIS